MRLRLKAGQDEIESFWRQEVRSYALDVYFRDWSSVPPDMRHRVVDLADKAFALLGRNPLNVCARLCLWCARKNGRAWLMPIAYLGYRVERKLFIRRRQAIHIKA